MKTEVLNEYIYTSLVTEIARGFRAERIRQMIAAGSSDDELARDLISNKDLTAAVTLFEQRRREVLAIRQASAAASC